MDATETVARAIAGLDGVEYDDAHKFDQMDLRGKARELIAAFPQLAHEGREEWGCVLSDGTFREDSREEAEEVRRDFPGVDLAIRTVWESPWSEVQS